MGVYYGAMITDWNSAGHQEARFSHWLGFHIHGVRGHRRLLCRQVQNTSTLCVLEQGPGFILTRMFLCSIAIMSDAAHMFSDVFSLVVSVYCMRLIESKSDMTYSFGYHRAETMGALISIIIVCILTGGLVLEAAQRLANPDEINGKLMFTVSALGILFNLLLLFTLGHDHHVHLGGGSCGHDHGHGGCGDGHSHSFRGHKDSLSHKDSELETVHAHTHSNDAEGDVAIVVNGVHARGHSHGSTCEHNHGSHSHSHGSHDHAHGRCGGHSHGKPEETQQLCGHVDDHDHGCNHSHEHCHEHHGHDHDNQNLRGAIVHVMGDLLQSVGVAAAGAVIWYALQHHHIYADQGSCISATMLVGDFCAQFFSPSAHGTELSF